METELTLYLDDEWVALAEEQARQQGRSLSQLVRDYFVAFVRMPDKQSAAPISE